MSIYNKDFLKSCKIRGDQISCEYGGSTFDCDKNKIHRSENLEVMKCKENTPFDLVVGGSDHPHKITRSKDEVCFGDLNGKDTTCVGGKDETPPRGMKAVTRFGTATENPKVDRNLQRFIENFSLLDPNAAEHVSTKINRVVDAAIKKTLLR